MGIVEESITIGTQYQLAGILTLPVPAADTPCPAVVLVHGSGAHDMNEKVGNVQPFKDLAEGLARCGIATIRYNKRTLTYGKELVQDSGLDLTVKEETIEDAIYAADLAKNDPRIDSQKVFLLGHSMGGMLVPRIDADGGDFAGLIIWAGSPRRLEEIIIDQQDAFMKTAHPVMKWVMRRRIGALRDKFDRLYNMSDEEAKKTPLFNKYSTMYYLKEWGEKPAARYMQDLDKPILVMHAGADVHVSTEKDFEAYRKLLADHRNATFKLYPDLNHMFMQSIYSDIKKALKEYKIPQTVSATVIHDICQWIHARGE
ncbi:alpha/beta hydrolase family protein [Spirochaeta africana]|uniref:Dienelactone hydrolase family protein n=1 Tax=Spirochaeta africana (strain ATCC 700263 / DSM 8902 / Z-7692) TaxID=889378 RepID=H9ULB0_SPIAZ|nr:alpha/beta fold hydrolase [Spirochaeta africana]AFG38303.1 Dienelactone hydrolase family protein [Spirochaeta africana DSM 8902]